MLSHKHRLSSLYYSKFQTPNLATSPKFQIFVVIPKKKKKIDRLDHSFKYDVRLCCLSFHRKVDGFSFQCTNVIGNHIWWCSFIEKKTQIKWGNSKEKDDNYIIRSLWNIRIFQNKIYIIWFRNNRFFKIIFIYLDFWTKFNSSPLLRGGGVLLFLFCSLPFQSLTLYNIYYVNSSSQNILRRMLLC